MCVQEEERMKLEKPDVAYLTTTSSKKRKGSHKGKEVSKIQKNNTSVASSSNKSFTGKFTCKFCRKEGHKQKDCPEFKEWLAKKVIIFT